MDNSQAWNGNCIGTPRHKKQGNRFEVDLYVLPIWGLDIVLGMHWLRTLGSCIHDHNELTMEFQWKGKQVKLEGNTKLTTHEVSFTQFNALILEGDVRGEYKLTTAPSKEVEHRYKELGTTHTWRPISHMWQGNSASIPTSF